jgi:hypothetical protein
MILRENRNRKLTSGTRANRLPARAQSAIFLVKTLHVIKHVKKRYRMEAPEEHLRRHEKGTISF